MTPIEKLHNVLRTLRSPEGCPWDRKQTHESLLPFAIEECAEFMDSVEEGDVAGMKEELGDMLMHIVLHSVIAEERGAFTFDDVVEGITEKMIRRHPHVFGSAPVLTDADEVPGVWEKIKADERERQQKVRTSILDGLPRNLPALTRAHKICEKAAKVGFDWPNTDGVLEKLSEEWTELQEALSSDDEAHIDEELGDLLFVLTSLARLRKRGTAEQLLHKTLEKFRYRFGYIERRLAEEGRSPEQSSLAEMEALWQQAKGASPKH